MKFIAFITILLGSACTTTNNSLQQGSTELTLAGVWKVEQSAFRSSDSVGLSVRRLMKVYTYLQRDIIAILM